MSRAQSVDLGNGASVMIIRPPTLIANMDPSIAIPTVMGDNQVGMNIALLDPNDAPRIAASRAITIGGTATQNDTIDMTVNGVALPTYTVPASPSLTIIAAGLASLINNSNNASIKGVVAASSAAAVLTIRAVSPGPVGNALTFVFTLSGGASETITPASGNLTGGAGFVHVDQTFEFSLPTPNGPGSQTFFFLEGKNYSIGDPLLTAMIVSGMPIS